MTGEVSPQLTQNYPDRQDDAAINPEACVFSQILFLKWQKQHLGLIHPLCIAPAKQHREDLPRQIYALWDRYGFGVPAPTS